MKNIIVPLKSLLLATACLATLICLPLVRPAGAQPATPAANAFKSPKGFTLHYPSGWLVASKDQTAQAAQIVQPYLAKLGQVDLDRLAVIVFDPNGTTFMANLNLIITPHTLAISEEHKDDMRALVLQLGKVFGSEPQNIRISIESIGGHQAMVARYDITMGGIPITQMQAIIPGHNQTYLATSSCAQADAAQYEPVFNTMFNGLDIDEGFAGIPQSIRFAVIGGLIGGAWALFQSLNKRGSANPVPPPPETPATPPGLA
jgi:hypothetical protein